MTLHSNTRIVRMQDVDAAGILFFPKFLEYCHDAYFELLDNKGMNLPSTISSGPYILPLVHSEANYKAPLRFGDEILVSVDKAIAGKTSYTVCYTVSKIDRENTICCLAKTVHAAISRTTFKPLKGIPEELRKALEM